MAASTHLCRYRTRPLDKERSTDLIEDYRFESVRALLKSVGDVERILARVALGSARPRDLTRLCDSLATLPQLRAELSGIDPTQGHQRDC